MPLLYGSTYLLMQSGRGGYVCVAEAEDDRNGGQRGRESAIGTHASGLIKDKVGARLGQDRASDTVVKLSNLIAVRAATERYIIKPWRDFTLSSSSQVNCWYL